MQRRTFLQASLGTLAAVHWPYALAAETESSPVEQALLDSDLVYLSPIKTDGSLSTCQAEIWFVMLDEDLYVCTRSGSWRAEAPAKGLTNTQFWVGDKGVWKRAKYQSLPKIKGIASIETDADTIESALEKFGQKYSSGWRTWGPKFREGLEDGSRTLLRYKLQYPA